MDEAIVVFVSCASLGEGETIARHLLDLRLVACATLTSHVRSYYVWQAQRREATEYQLILKTVRERFAALEAEVRRLHSYEVPEILALAAAEISAPYLNWIVASVKA